MEFSVYTYEVPVNKYIYLYRDRVDGDTNIVCNLGIPVYWSNWTEIFDAITHSTIAPTSAAVYTKYVYIVCDADLQSEKLLGCDELTEKK